MSGLQLKPVTFRQACEFVTAHHRHHKPPRGHKFSIGCVNPDEQLVGVIMVGRPVARSYDDGWTAEVNRSCVLPTARNANSLLYGAAWRAAKAMGYRRAITYTQEGESGASLRGAGWVKVAERAARKSWKQSSVALASMRDDEGAGGVARILWEVRR